MSKTSRLLALPQMKHMRNKHIHVFQTPPSNTQSNAQMIFYGSKPKQNSSCVMAQKHTQACTEQVGMCVPAQINIWLTLQSGYYLAEISEREVGGLAAFFVYPPLTPFFCRCKNTVITGCNATPYRYPTGP